MVSGILTMCICSFSIPSGTYRVLYIDELISKSYKQETTNHNAKQGATYRQTCRPNTGSNSCLCPVTQHLSQRQNSVRQEGWLKSFIYKDITGKSY